MDPLNLSPEQEKLLRDAHALMVSLNAAKNPQRKIGEPMLTVANAQTDAALAPIDRLEPGAGGWKPGAWVAPVVAIGGGVVLAVVPFITGALVFTPGAAIGAALTALVTSALGYLGIKSAGPRQGV